jgi:molecular chaperone DnaK
MGRIVGIDLGTTYSSIAYLQGEESRIIPNELGELRTPSVVHIQEAGTALVGTLALRKQLLNPENTIFGAKRFMGKRYNEIFDLARKMPFPLAIGQGNLAVFQTRDRIFTPQEIGALILRSLKQSAEKFLDERITEAVISVPAYFGDAQRLATRQAAEIAGLQVKRMLAEPTAASMAFKGVLSQQDATLAVLDLGGGTFDVTIIELANFNGEATFEVITVSGDNFLGGDDFDARLEEWLIQGLFDAYGIDYSADLAVRNRLRQAAIQAKHALTDTVATKVQLPYIARIGHKWIHFERPLSRDGFATICAELFERLRPPCNKVLDPGAFGSFHSGDIDEVLLVGGASRMPKFFEIAETIFGKRPRTLINAQDAVAMGSAIQAGVLDGKVKDALLLDATNHGYGVQTNDGNILLIETDSTIPTDVIEAQTPLLDQLGKG